jgi:predicted RND superfamily exporter protein
MGKLMALSLLTTLAAAVVFQPALMATQQQKRLPNELGSPQNEKLR